MAKTLQEMLENDFGAGTEKTASVQPMDSMDKLAMELGLFGDFEKQAEEGEQEEKGEEKEDKEDGEEKEASVGLDALYNSLFPEDSSVAVVKTAEEKQAASAEEAIGARAYDYYRQQMDNRIEKIAMDALQGKFAEAATTDGDGEAEPNDKVMIPNNRAGKGAIDTARQEQGDLGATNGPADIGHEQMQTIKAASVEQQALMSEMFGRGQDMACAIADQMDKVAEESEKTAGEELQLDEEAEKLAAVCGAFIERGQFEKLAELGIERHNDPLHYLAPYVHEKVAESGAAAALKNFGKRVADVAKAAPGKAMEAAKAAPGKAKEVAQSMSPSRIKGHVQMAAHGKAFGYNKKERAMEAGKALAKSLPYAGAVGGTGYGVKKLVSKKDENKED